jgi:ATP-dependent RNA helicase RhlE
MHVDRTGKTALLAEILRGEAIDRVLVFTRTKRGADKVVSGLAKAGLTAEAIHGNKSQNQRERVLAGFRAGRVRTLVATDIAARGIDVEGISHVVNYDLPNIPESYVHRIGRTARAGADGVAISFCDHEERAFLRDIEKLIRMSIPATDRRSDQRLAPEHRASSSAGAKPPRPQQQNRNRQHQGRQGDQKQARGGSNRQQERRTDHQPAHRAPANGARAHGPKGHGPKGHGTSANASSQPHRNAEQPAAAHDPGIGTVAFLQPRREQRRPSRPNASRHAPR